MSHPKQIRTLVDHVYGPYWDYVVLKDRFPVQQGQPLLLSDIQMFCNNKPVGLDDTEFVGEPPQGSLSSGNGKVIFFGVLEIQSLEWLSERGLDYLEKDLREYDAKVHLEHIRSGLTLKALYGQRKDEGSRIKVRICCNKNLQAAFLTNESHPEKLLFFSRYEVSGDTTEKLKRLFWIQTMHVSTFRSSRNFFDRYRLRALISQLGSSDPDNTPPEDRDIEWLIRRYLATIHPRDADIRLIVGDDLDFDPSAEPKHIRHLAKARIRGYFAAHAEWLLAHMLASTSKQVKLLNIGKWIQFCRQAHIDSLEAKKNGIRWGVPHGASVNEAPYRLSQNLAKYGHKMEFWENKLANVLKKKDKPSLLRTRDLSEPLPDDNENFGQFQYDSDFSEPSTPGASDTESDTEIPPFIPNFCLEPPRIPTGRFSWNCQGCAFQVDLLDLSQEHLDLLPPNVSQRLGEKTWRFGEEPVQKALFTIVSRHYQEKHLYGHTIAARNAGGWHISSKEPVRTGKQTRSVAVKQEVDEISLETPRRSSRPPRPRSRLD